MERLFTYLETHYLLNYIPTSMRKTLRDLNNGMSEKYGWITITYDDMLHMLRYYERELFRLYKNNIKNGKCKTGLQRAFYDISVMVDWYDKYKNRPEALYNELTHSQILHPEIDGGESIQDNSRILTTAAKKIKEENAKAAAEAEMVKEMLKELEEMEKEEEKEE